MAQANTFAKRFAGASTGPIVNGISPSCWTTRRNGGRTTTSCWSGPSWFYEAVSFSEAMKSQTPGLGQAYLGAYTDANGDVARREK